MSRTLQNLQRLRRKMQDRYGGSDELVLQLDREIAAREVLDSRLLTPAPAPAASFSGPPSSHPNGASDGY